MKSDIFIAGMLIASGIYGWAYVYFHPDKLSPRMPHSVFRWLCIFMIAMGAVLIVSRIL